MRNWQLINLVVRKGCKLCTAPPEVQEWLLEQIEKRAPIRETLYHLARIGYTISEKTYHTHKKHLRQFLERAAQPTLTQLPSMRQQLERERMQLEALKLARTREEKARAALEALKDLVSPEHYQVILAILEAEQND